MFHIKHINNRQGATFFLPETDGAEIIPLVAPTAKEKVIIKHRPDSFFQTDLQNLLEEKKISGLVGYGMMTHMRMDTTVKTAKNPGYNISLIEDACATKDLTHNDTIIPAASVGNIYMASLAKTFAEIANADQWIKEYAKSSCCNKNLKSASASL